MTKWLQTLVGIVLLIALALAVLWLGREFLLWVVAQSSEVVGAIIACAGTVIAGIGAVVISQQRTKAREIAESHRPKKTEIYSEFIKMVVGIMRTQKSKKNATADPSEELEEFFFSFTTDVMLWGSPGVLRSYGEFRRVGQQKNPNVILMVDDILQAMRKDLGLSNRGLNRGDLIKMLLTDPEKVDELVQKRWGK